MSVETFYKVVSNSLYEKRFGPYMICPVVAGLENGEPYCVGYDTIGSYTV